MYLLCLVESSLIAVICLIWCHWFTMWASPCLKTRLCLTTDRSGPRLIAGTGHERGLCCVRGALPRIEQTCLCACGEGGHRWIVSSIFMGSGVCVLGMQTLANMVTNQPPNLVHACMLSGLELFCHVCGFETSFLVCCTLCE